MVQQGRRRPLLAGIAVIATAIAFIGEAVDAQPAGASATCTGVQTTWTGLGDGTSWSLSTNWSPAVPSPSDVVTVDTSATPDPVSIVGVAGTVCDLTVTAASATRTSFTGDLRVDGDASVTGAVGWAGELRSTQSLSVAPSTDLLMGDGSVVAVEGQATLASAALVHGATGASTTPVVQVTGGLTLGGSAHLAATGLQLLAGPSGSGSVDLAGKTLTVDGAAVSRFAASTMITSSQPDGVLVLGTGAQLVAVTGTTVQRPAVLRIAGASFGGGGQALTLAGTGTLSWRSGAVVGDLTLRLPTVLDGAGTRVVPADSTLRSTSQLSVVDGTLHLSGTLLNSAIMSLSPGATVVGTEGAPSSLSNLVGASLAVAPTGVGDALLEAVHLTNAGTISVPLNARLVLGSSGAQTTSDLLDGSTVRAPALPSSSGTDAPGTLQVSQGSTLHLTGRVQVDKALLLLDDRVGAGSTARLEAVGASATLTATNLSSGSFSWRNGTLVGAVTIDKLTSDLSSDRDGTHRVLEGVDDAHPGRLRLGGIASLQATLELAPKATVVVPGTLTLACTAGGIHPVGNLDHQKLVVATGGLLRSVAQPTTPGGSCNPLTGITISVPVLNNGTVSLKTPVHVPAGYTQDVAVGAAATADLPVTGLFGSAVLSSSNGTTAGPITLVRGGLGGTGTVEANPLTTGTGFLHPGTSTTSGTMTLKGPVHLGSGTDLQIVLRSATDHDRLVVRPLTVGATTYPGTLALNGRISGISSNPSSSNAVYDPAYGTVVAGVVTADLRSATFHSADSGGTTNGRGWRPTYPNDNKTVGLSIVDVAPPSLGIADIPAFTQLTSQRFTYYAVDNRSGVKNYDVRYRFGSSNVGWSPLAYPSSWQGTRATSVNLTSLRAGFTYCFSVRARDNSLNITLWSQELCTARLYDDRVATASSGWSRSGGQPGDYYGTLSITTRLGATLKRGATFRRLAVTARRCPRCGALAVYSGSTLIAKVNLASTATGTITWVSSLLKSRLAIVTLKVITSGRLVAIDAIGLAR